MTKDKFINIQKLRIFVSLIKLSLSNSMNKNRRSLRNICFMYSIKVVSFNETNITLQDTNVNDYNL